MSLLPAASEAPCASVKTVRGVSCTSSAVPERPLMKTVAMFCFFCLRPMKGTRLPSSWGAGRALSVPSPDCLGRSSGGLRVKVKLFPVKSRLSSSSSSSAHLSADMDFSIRAANVEDCKDIARMIRVSKTRADPAAWLEHWGFVASRVHGSEFRPEKTRMMMSTDVNSCFSFQELAEYEKMADHVKVTQRDLEQDGFSKNPFFHGIVAESSLITVCWTRMSDCTVRRGGMLLRHTKIGYALYFYSYSSWAGRAIYMEDLYVMPEFRGKGIGKALMSKVAQLGLAAGCNQLNFTVLDWNKSSVDFYLSQGCFDVTDKMGYHCMRCEGEALEHLAQP
ncbi:hypothetical protein CCH79_00012914 [Gambusia affinis]|uniref:N-acetyltransferase domain-containing protein n=1 Tax=Gambusia affinis TaxID=33528 RepID=A0A315W020_GAMAF|nr:hypothetical protein CCH79_00012914 [Gambusia affinis]